MAEGEKDVDALVRAGEVATCNPMGAGKWRPEHAQALVGAAVVVIIADKDDAGRAHAFNVAKSLRGQVGQLVIAEARVGKDAADHLAGGFGVDDFVGVEDSGGAVPSSTAAELLERVSQVLRRFVVWPCDEQVHFVSLWVVTHLRLRVLRHDALSRRFFGG